MSSNIIHAHGGKRSSSRPRTEKTSPARYAVPRTTQRSVGRKVLTSIQLFGRDLRSM